MRIVGGKFGSRKFPTGAPKGARPTTDASRESLFATLENLTDFDGARVCDLFAGTGSLGIEAISRGAASCAFADVNGKALSQISKFLKELKFDRFETIKSDSARFLKSAAKENRSFDIIFADPPYGKGFLNEIAALAAETDVLATGGLLVFEVSSSENPIAPPNLHILKEKISGGTKILVYRKSDHNPR